MREIKYGKDAPNWRGGKPKCLDCGKQLVLYTAKRCKSCARKGDLAYQWKGGRVGYGALHDWVRKELGSPKSCEHCKSPSAKKYEWANISKKYKRDLADWIRLCSSCHRKFDGHDKKMIASRKRIKLTSTLK